MQDKTMQDLLNTREEMLANQRNIYMTSISNINMRYGELLKNNFGSELVKNCARDVAGEVVRRFFDTADYYITVDQMYDRIVHFSYDGGVDPLSDQNESIRKNIYNMNDDPHFSRTLKDISKQCQQAQTKLFHKETYIDGTGKSKRRYTDRSLMEEGKAEYRELMRGEDGKLYDKLSGVSDEAERLEVDHVQAAATARYNSRYINSPEAKQALKEFYNSPENFQMLEKRANGSKGDVRVYADGDKTLTDTEVKAIRKEIRDKVRQGYIDSGMDSNEAGKKAGEIADREIETKYDITYKADAKQVTDAICKRWENTTGETKKELQRTGKLDENGKVPDNVKEKLERDLKISMNAESKVILQYLDYSRITEDALDKTKKGLTKIISGQVIYYVLPPVVFETQCIIKKKGMTIERFFEELKAAEKRIVSYVKSQLKNIFKNIVVNSLNKFIKTFFDILIEVVKETAKRLVKIAKQLVLSLVQCVKIITSQKSTAAEKADAVTRILSVTVTTVVLEILFEYMEDAFGLPDIIMEPLQIITTIIATNLIMLILQKADLFDVKYGLLIENLNAAFQQEQILYENSSKELLEEAKMNIESSFETVKAQIMEIQSNIKSMDFYTEDVTGKLDEFNKIYEMGIDFNKEWQEFCLEM